MKCPVVSHLTLNTEDCNVVCGASLSHICAIEQSRNNKQ